MKKKILLSLIGLIIISSSVVVVPSALAQDQQPKVLWSQKAGYQPIDIQVGDLNGDSKPDVVVGYSEPAILAIGSDGEVLWRFETKNRVWHVAIGDINGDGKNDVAGYEAQQPSFLYAIDNLGEKLWTYQLPITGSGNEFSDHVKIGNVLGDGKNEVIVGADASSTLYIFDGQGSVQRTYSAPSYITSLELSDMRDDGLQDMVVSYGSMCPPCGIQVVDGEGNLIWNYPTSARLGDAAVGDINGDGKTDVVVAEWMSSGSGKVYAVDNSGFLLWRFDLEGQASSLALHDINGDGKLDVIVGSDDDHHVYAIDSKGQLIWRFNTGANVFKVDAGDLDADGRIEVAAATMGAAGGVYAIHIDGSLMWFFPKKSSEDVQGFRDLVVVDLDGDGDDEVVAIQDDIGLGIGTRGESGLVYALATPPVAVVTLEVRETGKPVTHIFTNIPSAQSKVEIHNGTPGLTNLAITVNGKKFEAAGLKHGEERTIDASPAMVVGNNIIDMEARGKPGGSAVVLIHD